MTVNTKLDILLKAVLDVLPEGKREQLLESLEENQGTMTVDEIEDETKQFLVEIGMNPAHTGFRAAARAIAMAVETPDIVSRATKVLYPEVGKHIGHTGTQTERAIRHAVEKWFEVAKIEEIRKLFPVVNWERGKVANTHFISRCAYIMKQRIERTGGKKC